MDENQFQRAVTDIFFAGYTHEGAHKCAACLCDWGPVGWHRHCDGECNPTAFGHIDIPESEK